MPTGVIGVGYEDRSVTEFVLSLRAHGVHVLLDARQVPRCSRRGFSRHSLAEALRSVGIHYVHYEVLGNPDQNQAGFGGDATAMAAAAARYRTRLAEPAAQAVLTDLIAVSRRRLVAVMTMEVDAERSHRATLLAEIERRAENRPADIDAVLAEFLEPAVSVAAEPVDTRTKVERDIDELLAEFS
jgi:uncharacterized protein (DUF488 family)